MLFRQATAPLGWTKMTDIDNAALRIVSGTPASGGTVGFSTLFGRTSTDNTTLAESQIPIITPAGIVNRPTISVIDNTGGGAHSHGLDMRIKYVDSIFAQRD